MGSVQKYRNVALLLDCWGQDLTRPQSLVLHLVGNAGQSAAHRHMGLSRARKQLLHKSGRLAKRVARPKFGLQSFHFRRRTIRHEMIQGRQWRTLWVQRNLTLAWLDPGSFHRHASKERVECPRSVIVDRPHIAAARARPTCGGNLFHLGFDCHFLDLREHRMPIFQKQTDPFRVHMLSSTAPSAEAMLRSSSIIKDRFNLYPDFHTNLPT